MIRLWPILLPLPGFGWWLMGFPPGWGWLVVPMFPPMPVNVGMLIVLALVLIGLWRLAQVALENV
jgi:hypothetical protein